ncbi:hypothetical protein HN587_03295 [Candidatus Woesearchaeota archaeon]|jgi:hypothetical protein|nr:hypothetical protein [Candidatus Woesearchaeota archaeon]
MAHRHAAVQMHEILGAFTPDKLTPQQRALVLTIFHENPNQLNCFEWVDEPNGQKRQPPVNEFQLETVLTRFENDPANITHLWNEAISWIFEPERQQRYLKRSLDFEVILDHKLFPCEGDHVKKGIPLWLPDGYTDMGQKEDDFYRGDREKFRFRKVEGEVRNYLIAAKQFAIENLFELGVQGGEHKVVQLINQYINDRIQYDGWFVTRKARDVGNKTVCFNDLRAEGMDDQTIHKAVCRHKAVIFQLMCQAAGIKSSLVKGNMYLDAPHSRHAWNEVTLDGTVYTADVTNPTEGKLTLYASGDEVFKMMYETTAPDRNNYKIKWS